MNSLIYENPRLNIFQKIGMFWRNEEFHVKGFTTKYKKNMEGKNGTELLSKGCGGQQEVREEGIDGKGQDIPTSGGDKGNKKERLNFYDFKTKKKFESDEYDIKFRGKRRFAVAVAPSGSKTWRAMKKE